MIFVILLCLGNSAPKSASSRFLRLGRVYDIDKIFDVNINVVKDSLRDN